MTTIILFNQPLQCDSTSHYNVIQPAFAPQMLHHLTEQSTEDILKRWVDHTDRDLVMPLWFENVNSMPSEGPLAHRRIICLVDPMHRVSSVALCRKPARRRAWETKEPHPS